MTQSHLTRGILFQDPFTYIFLFTTSSFSAIEFVRCRARARMRLDVFGTALNTNDTSTAHSPWQHSPKRHFMTRFA
jgi:hypothetical protein